METRLKAARRERGWSQLRLIVELERASSARGVQPPSRSSLKTQVSRWENGRVGPDEFYASLFANIYETTPHDLGLDEQGGLWLPTSPAAVTPSAELVHSLGAVLAEYARADNLTGPGNLARLAIHHVDELERLALEARGTLRDQILRLCSQFAEFAGWLYQDGGDLLEAERWTSRAMDFVEGADDWSLRAYLLMRKSAVAGDRGDLVRALQLAEAASAEIDRKRTRLDAVVLRQLAVSHAVMGNGLLSERAAESSLQIVASEPSGDDPAYCTEAYILMEAGAASLELKHLDLASARLTAAIGNWPDGFARDQSIAYARLALAKVGQGDIDGACASGLHAVERAGSSARAGGLLRDLNRRLAPHRRSTVVQEFRDQSGFLA